jgi:nitroimidazol reductase NimA-like FMN-containing flavoprotein (pyridoxamine 5'-phosphate oxidase superfamily)
MSEMDHPTREQRRGRRIAMSAAELDEYLDGQLTCRVASNGTHGPHNAPLWFLWDGDSVWLYSIVNSQRWHDLQADPRVAVVVDSGQAWNELRGVEIQGRAVPEGEVPRVGRPAADQLIAVEAGFQQKYRAVNPKYRDRPDAPLEYDSRHAWLRIHGEKVTSWDFRKI